MKKPITALLLAIVFMVGILSGCAGSTQNNTDETTAAPAGEAGSLKFDAVYLGVAKYGAEETNKDNKNDFVYRFESDGKEVFYKMDNGVPDENGAYEYPVQNMLKEGYAYLVTVTAAVGTGRMKAPLFRQERSAYHGIGGDSLTVRMRTIRTKTRTETKPRQIPPQAIIRTGDTTSITTRGLTVPDISDG